MDTMVWCFKTNVHEKISPFWLVKSSAVFLETVQKRVNSGQNEVTNQAFWLVNDHRNSQMAGWSYLSLSNQARAMDGAIYGVIFPWMRDTRAFLLLNYLEKFSSILVIRHSNHMIFLAPFGTNKHL